MVVVVRSFSSLRRKLPRATLFSLGPLIIIIIHHPSLSLSLSLSTVYTDCVIITLIPYLVVRIPLHKRHPRKVLTAPLTCPSRRARRFLFFGFRPIQGPRSLGGCPSSISGPEQTSHRARFLIHICSWHHITKWPVTQRQRPRTLAPWPLEISGRERVSSIQRGTKYVARILFTGRERSIRGAGVAIGTNPSIQDRCDCAGLAIWMLHASRPQHKEQVGEQFMCFETADANSQRRVSPR